MMRVRRNFFVLVWRELFVVIQCRRCDVCDDRDHRRRICYIALSPATMLPWFPVANEFSGNGLRRAGRLAASIQLMAS